MPIFCRNAYFLQKELISVIKLVMWSCLIHLRRYINIISNNLYVILDCRNKFIFAGILYFGRYILFLQKLPICACRIFCRNRIFCRIPNILLNAEYLAKIPNIRPKYWIFCIYIWCFTCQIAKIMIIWSTFAWFPPGYAWTPGPWPWRRPVRAHGLEGGHKALWGVVGLNLVTFLYFPLCCCVFMGHFSQNFA